MQAQEVTKGKGVNHVLFREKLAASRREKHDIREKIREFILDYFVEDHDLKLTYDSSLLDEGIVDAIDVMKLVAFVEEQFGIWMEDEEICPDNYETVNKLTNYIFTVRDSHRSFQF